MNTDPKKNDEVKDEELDKVSGGSETAPPDEQADGDARRPGGYVPEGMQKKERT